MPKAGPWTLAFPLHHVFLSQKHSQYSPRPLRRRLVLRWCWEQHCPSKSVTHPLSPLQTTLWSRGTSPSLLERHGASHLRFCLESNLKALWFMQLCVWSIDGSLGPASVFPTQGLSSVYVSQALMVRVTHDTNMVR